MPIVFPLSLPTVNEAASLTMRPRSVVGISQSPFTLQQQIQVHPGQAWEIDISMPVMERVNAAEWFAFKLKMNGMEGTALVGDPTGQTARGTASTTPGTPVVNGADQVGNVLALGGLPAAETGYLLTGDYIQLGTGSDTHLHQVLNDVNTDGGGLATLDIWPKLRIAPANGAAVLVANAKGLFRLNKNAMDWSAIPGPFYNMSFGFVEAL